MWHHRIQMPTMAMAYLALALAGQPSPENTVNDVLTRYLRQSASVGHLQGARALFPFLTKRLQRVLDDASACQKDWERQQPKGSTDKPPFVDCCTFASSPEGIPTSFRLVGTQAYSGNRFEVRVEYTYAEQPGTYADRSIPLGTWHWQDAVIVARVDGAYLVDDFLFLRDTPREPPGVLSTSYEGCRGPVWVGLRRGNGRAADR
jgi:hypothetical protein